MKPANLKADAAMSTKQDRNFTGILLMVASMALFAVADLFIKIAADTLSAAMTAFLLIGGSAITFGALALVQGAPILDRRAFQPILLIRYAAEILGLVGMITALALVPLSTLGAILQATPLLVAAGAVLFLGEQVTWRRWAAICVGFLGVLLIIRPGTDGFEPSTGWALLAMVALSVRDLSTRVVPRDIPTASLTTFTMLAIFPVTVVWAFMSDGTLLPPSETNVWLMLGMILSGTFGYWLITVSVRMAEVSVVAPFRYSRLIFLLIFGVWFFNERPDALTLFGAALIIASGIYTMWRDRMKSRLEERLAARTR